jgi:hypothetical protein
LIFHHPRLQTIVFSHSKTLPHHSITCTHKIVAYLTPSQIASTTVEW